MFRLYSLLYSIAFVAMLPVFLLKREKYLEGFSERFGRLPEFHKDGRPVIWIHCVSVGEANAAAPLIKQLKKKYPGYRLVISTITRTGQELCKAKFSEDADLIFYFPFDWKFTVLRSIRAIRPAIVLVLETEIWFNFFREIRRRGIVLAIVNGRVSDKSEYRYGLIPKTIARVLRYPTAVFAQSEQDAARFHELGVKKRKLHVTGNLKFDQETEKGGDSKSAYFRERFGIDGKAPVIVAASTHEPEEKWLLDAFEALTAEKGCEGARMFIAPRHPERFDAVAELVSSSGLSWARRTAGLDLEDEDARIILLDSIGELRAVYPLADVVFVGGSLIPHGGQNVLEPAAEAKAIVTGSYMSNFRAIADAFVGDDAMIMLPELEDDEVSAALTDAFSSLILDTDKRDELGSRAESLVLKNRGAAERVVELMRPHLQINSRKTTAAAAKSPAE